MCCGPYFDLPTTSPPSFDDGRAHTHTRGRRPNHEGLFDRLHLQCRLLSSSGCPGAYLSQVAHACRHTVDGRHASLPPLTASLSCSYTPAHRAVCGALAPPTDVLETCRRAATARRLQRVPPPFHSSAIDLIFPCSVTPLSLKDPPASRRWSWPAPPGRPPSCHRWTSESGHSCTS